MLKCYPYHVVDHYSPSTFNHSRAEYEVYKYLKESNLDGFLLHSLNLADGHRIKGWAEIDIVLITKFGVMCLEAKGGALKRDDRGHWHNKTKQIESPFVQAKDAHFNLKKHVEENMQFKQLSKGKGRLRFGWGLVLANCRVIPDTVEHPQWLQASIADMKDRETFLKYLSTLESNWNRKLPGRYLKEEEQQEIVDFLRPEFDLSIPLGKRLDESNEEAKRFTDEQIERLDEIKDNDRILCTGGAGTGKTFIAVADARREACNDKKVLFLARNEKLIADLSSKEQHPNLTFKDFNNLESCKNSDVWDVLIVDEGQDLLSIEKLETLDAILKDGLSAGRWRWFMDDFYQSGFYEEVDMGVLDLLKDKGVTTRRLQYNCRNTKQIVEFTQLLTGAEIGKAKLRGDGAQPDIIYVKNTKEEKDHVLSCVVDWIRKEEVAADDIVAISIADHFDEDSDCHELRANLSELGVRCVSARDFKGLESKCAIVFGLYDGSFSSEQFICRLYTALTRATMRLSLLAPCELRDELEEVYASHLETMMQRKVSV